MAKQWDFLLDVSGAHGPFEHIPTPNPSPQLGTQQKRPAQFPMQAVRLLGRRRQPLPHHDGYEPPHPIRNRLVAKIIDGRRILGKGLGEGQDGTDVRVEHGFTLPTRQVAQLDAQIPDGGAVGARRRDQSPDVGFDEAVREVAAGAEIEELESVGRGIVEEIRPVGIRLHELELGDLAQAEAQDLGADPVALVLGEGLDFGHAGAVEVLGRQDLRARRFGYDGRDVEDVFLIGQKGAEAFAHLGFPDVIAFPSQFGPGVCNCLVEEEAFGEKAGGGEQDGEIREVAVYGVGHTWVLDLHRDSLVRRLQSSAVDLANRCGCHGLFVKRGKEITPFCAEVTCEDLVTLRSRHVVRAILNPLQNFVDWSRQHFRIYH